MESKDLMDKLERVERTVNIYSETTEEQVEEIPIDIPLERLKNIVTPKDGDSLLYLGYVLNEEQLRQINIDLSNKITSDFNLYFYVLECQGIYNW